MDPEKAIRDALRWEAEGVRATASPAAVFSRAGRHRTSRALVAAVLAVVIVGVASLGVVRYLNLPPASSPAPTPTDSADVTPTPAPATRWPNAALAVTADGTVECTMFPHGCLASFIMEPGTWTPPEGWQPADDTPYFGAEPTPWELNGRSVLLAPETLDPGAYTFGIAVSEINDIIGAPNPYLSVRVLCTEHVTVPLGASSVTVHANFDEPCSIGIVIESRTATPTPPATATATTVPTPTPVATPSSGATCSGVTTLPCPPAGFDPASITWAGDVRTGSTLFSWDHADLWLGQIDGGMARRIVEGRVGSVEMLAEGRILYSRSPDATGADFGLPTLYLYDQATNTTTAITELESRYAVAAVGGVIFVNRTVGTTGPAGLWKVPFDGGEGQLVIAPPDAPSLFQYGPVSSNDGLRVARTACAVEARRAMTQVLVEGRLFRLPPAVPVGFDWIGQLISFAGCERSELHAVDPATGVRTMLLGPNVDEAVVKSGGRRLAATQLFFPPSRMDVVWLDLEAGDTRRWTLASSAWQLTTLGGDRYIVLEGSPTEVPGGGLWFAIIDPIEGWLGYVGPWPAAP